MIKRGLIIITIILASLGFLSFLLPSKMHVERNRLLNHNRMNVYEYVSDLHTWEKWSPWALEDTSFHTSYNEVPEGKGQKQYWNTKKEGAGYVKIIRSIPNSLLEYEIVFDDYNSTAKGSLRLVPVGDKTRVVWTMTGAESKNPFHKYMNFVFKPYVAESFESGLSKLNDQLEDN
jgi:hypothetical protein